MEFASISCVYGRAQKWLSVDVCSGVVMGIRHMIAEANHIPRTGKEKHYNLVCSSHCQHINIILIYLHRKNQHSSHS